MVTSERLAGGSEASRKAQETSASVGPFKTPTEEADELWKRWQEDPAAWCHQCGARRQADCTCGPIAENH
jgi:hypothetical protein